MGCVEHILDKFYADVVQGRVGNVGCSYAPKPDHVEVLDRFGEDEVLKL